MMRSSAAHCIIWLALAAFFVTSCSTDYTDTSRTSAITPPEVANSEWIVMLYGAGNYAEDLMNGGQSRVIATVQSMQEKFPSEQVNVVALVSSEATGGSARLYRIGYRPNDPINTITSVELADWGPQDMSSTTVLTHFIDTTVARFPASKYMLAITGMGAGWRGACSDEVNGDGSPMSVSSMYNTLHSLTNIDGQSLRFNLVAWLCPEMGMTEVAYQFRNVADYMVACPSRTVHGHAVSAGRWLLDLMLEPTMNEQRLGRFVASRIEQSAL